MQIKNNFETGLAPGTLITVGNSDDGTPSAGDAVASVDQGGAGSSIAYDNAHAAHGGLSLKYTQGATPSYKHVYWNVSSATELWGRFGFYATALPANNFVLKSFWTGSLSGQILLRTDGQLEVQDSTLANKMTSGQTITLNAWNRIEWHFFANTSTGFVAIQFFLGDSTTPQGAGIYTSSAGNFGAAVTSLVHQVDATAANYVFWLDDFQANNSGWPGPATDYLSTVLANAPTIVYKLNEPSGAVVTDYSGNSDAGAIGGTVAYAATGVIAGDAAMGFTTSADFVKNTNTLNYPVATVEVWAKIPSAPGAVSAIVGFAQANNPSVTDKDLQVTTAGKLRFYVFDGAAKTIDGLTTITDNQWHHLVGVANGTDISIYVDGQDDQPFHVAAGATFQFYAAGQPSVQLGGGVWQSQTLAYFAVYPAALSAATINVHYHAGLPYLGVVLADTPAAYWRLDETSGTNAADSSGNAHPATYGAGVVLNQTSLIASDTDKSAAFANVANSIVNVNDLAVGNFSGNQAFSLECWFNASTLDATGRRFFEKYPGDGIDMSITSTLITFERDSSGSGGADNTVTAASPAAGATHHVVGTYDGTNLRLYLDGVLVGGPTAATHTLASLAASALSIGDRGDGARRFLGTLDEPAIYTAALTATQVLAHYKAGAPAAVSVGATPATRTRSLLGVGT